MADNPPRDEPAGIVSQLWKHPWGRVLMAAMTIAVVFWALRETAIVTTPILRAVADILLPLAIGFTIAYILSPLVDALARRGIPRLLGTSLLFAIMSIVTVVILSLVVPAVLRQGVDLGNRMVGEFYYVDMDGDGRFSRGDIRVYPISAQPGWFHEESDGTWAPPKPRYQRDDARLRLEPSLLAKFGTWVDRQTSPLRRFIGVTLDEDAERELAFYDAEVGVLIQALDQLMTLARDQVAVDDWPQALRPLDRPLPTIRDEHLVWPGIWSSDVHAIAEGLAEPKRSQWLQAIAERSQTFHQRHRVVIVALDRVRGGSGEDTPMVRRLRDALREELSSEQRQRMEALLPRLLRSEEGEHGEYAQRLLNLLRGAESGGSHFLRDLAQRMDAAISGELGGVAGAAGGWFRQLLSNIPALLSFGLNVILVPIYAFFLTMALPRIRTALRSACHHQGGERALRIAHAIERVVAAFFRGRLIVCAICAVLIYIGFVFLQVPYAALFAMLIGLATAVPLAGLLFLVPAVLLMLLDGSSDMTLRVSLVIALYAVVQTLEATVFTPLIMGREVELHPVTLIIALLFFGKLFGILGLILAVPIAATLRILLREFVWPRLAKRSRGDPGIAEGEPVSPTP